MEIRIKYPKRVSQENWKKDWGIRVNYNELPTKADIERDYKELPIPSKHWKKWYEFEKDNIKVLEDIFIIMNNSENPMSTDEMQDWIKENKVSHTSMSVGDVVELDNKIFVCATVGWKEVA